VEYWNIGILEEKNGKMKERNSAGRMKVFIPNIPVS
jgi:hypothetical protein